MEQPIQTASEQPVIDREKLSIPDLFEDFLNLKYRNDEESIDRIYEGLTHTRDYVLYVNPLRTTVEATVAALDDLGIAYEAVPWNPQVLKVEGGADAAIEKLEALLDPNADAEAEVTPDAEPDAEEPQAAEDLPEDAAAAEEDTAEGEEEHKHWLPFAHPGQKDPSIPEPEVVAEPEPVAPKTLFPEGSFVAEDLGATIFPALILPEANKVAEMRWQAAEKAAEQRAHDRVAANQQAIAAYEAAQAETAEAAGDAPEAQSEAEPAEAEAVIAEAVESEPVEAPAPLAYEDALSQELDALEIQPVLVFEMAAGEGYMANMIAEQADHGVEVITLETSRALVSAHNEAVTEQGIQNIEVRQGDNRRYGKKHRFDYILLDSACSKAGLINVKNPDLGATFIGPKVANRTELEKAQFLLALQMLKPGSALFYTCESVLGIECEDVVRECLARAGKYGTFIVEPFDFPGMDQIPTLPSRQKGTLCICPDSHLTGRYIAKIRRVK